MVEAKPQYLTRKRMSKLGLPGLQMTMKIMAQISPMMRKGDSSEVA